MVICKRKICILKDGNASLKEGLLARAAALEIPDVNKPPTCISMSKMAARCPSDLFKPGFLPEHWLARNSHLPVREAAGTVVSSEVQL